MLTVRIGNWILAICDQIKERECLSFWLLCLPIWLDKKKIVLFLGKYLLTRVTHPPEMKSSN